MVTGVDRPEVMSEMIDAAIIGDREALIAVIDTEEYKTALANYLRLPYPVRAINESLSVVFADMSIRAEFFLLRDYDDSEGVMDILICGNTVMEDLTNFNLKSLESIASFLLSFKLRGRHISITLSAAERPPWKTDEEDREDEE